MNDLMLNTSTLTMTMSSLEIATLVEKRHDNVLRDIRNMLEQLEHDPGRFRIVLNKQGKTKQMWLDEALSLTLVSGYFHRRASRLQDIHNMLDWWERKKRQPTMASILSFAKVAEDLESAGFARKKSATICQVGTAKAKI